MKRENHFVSDTAKALRVFLEGIEQNQSLLNDFVERVYLGLWPEMADACKQDRQAFFEEGTRRWAQRWDLPTPRTIDDVLGHAVTLGYNSETVKPVTLLNDVACELIAKMNQTSARKSRPAPLPLNSRRDKRARLGLLALLVDAEKLPLELELEAFAEMLRFKEAWATELLGEGMSVPETRSAWFELLGRLGVPVEYFLNGRIRPREVLMYWIGQKQRPAPPKMLPGKRRSRPLKVAPKRSWTQADLDTAIEEFKARRAQTYRELVHLVEYGHEGAEKAAREMFGRNELARRLGVKSAAMISKSPAWKKMCDDLMYPKRRKARTKNRDSEDPRAILPDDNAIVRAETILYIQSNLPADAAERLIDRVDGRHISCDEARAFLHSHPDRLIP